MFTLRANEALRSLAAPRRLQRAIGVIYRPETERQSHYFYTRLPDQFDAVIHFDETHALEPLDKGAAGTPASRRRPIPPAFEGER